MKRLLAALVLTTLTVHACNRTGPRDPWETGTVTLLVGERGPEIAEVIFEKNHLVRVEYKTDDPTTRARLKARLDEIMREAEREGLFVDYHEHSPKGDRDGLYAAKPMPGAPQFARAVYHHLSGRDFTARAK